MPPFLPQSDCEVQKISDHRDVKRDNVEGPPTAPDHFRVCAITFILFGMNDVIEELPIIAMAR